MRTANGKGSQVGVGRKLNQQAQTWLFARKTPTAERKRKLFNATKYEALIFTPMLKAHK